MLLELQFKLRKYILYKFLWEWRFALKKKKNVDSTGNLLNSLTLLVFQATLIVVKMTYQSITFTYKYCLPCNFILRNMIESAAKANFQSHSVFNKSDGRKFSFQKISGSTLSSQTAIKCYHC